MSRYLCISAILALICVFGGQVQAQTKPIGCSVAPNMVINATELSGTWYEVAINPQPVSFLGCVEVTFTPNSDNVSLDIATTYSNTPNMLNINMTTTSTIWLNSTDYVNGFNLTSNIQSSQNITYKILDTDYNNYAFICGYTNSSTGNITEFGAILTRQRNPTWAALAQYESNASASYDDFTNGTMYNITQTDNCVVNGSSVQSIPILAALLMTVFTLLKFFN